VPAPQSDKNASADRPKPPEPFEERGPAGGYGGAGVDDD
jgi:hypothetical protein